MATPNSLFVIFHVGKPPVVEAKLQAVAPWLHLAIEPGVWILVAPSGTTTKEVCEKIDIETGRSSGIVVRFDSYFGVASPSIWEWIAEKKGATLGSDTTST
jgi:hypothetical protein